jgi:uncharacterized Fe-S center protein
MPYVVTSECNLCGTCSAGCEGGAARAEDTQAAIDVTICIECGICAAICPYQAIVYEEEET